MAARKPPTPKKKKKVTRPAKTSVLGNDPFARGSAVREVLAQAAPPPREPARPVTPELQVGAQLQGPTEPRRPILQPIEEKPKSGSGLPQPAPRSVPRPHAGAPTSQPLTGATAHSGSPSLSVDPRPHAGAPTSQPLTGATAHSGSPWVSVDPRPHAGTPTSQPLTGAIAHAGSPSVTVEPALLARLDRAPAGLSSPTITGALKGLFNAARSSAGLASRATEVDRWGKDAVLASSLRPLGELLYEKYWRVRVEGAEHLPSGPFIIVANHAGALPLDGPVLHLALRRERPDLEESRWLLEDQIFHAPFVGVLANRLGAVRASPENALRLLDERRPLIVFPEGFHGLSKPFSERYQLRRFGRGGYVKIALRAKVPIVPAAIIGGEESMPLLGKLPGGFLGLQYLPITLPPLPARWHIRFATPISLEGAPPEPEHDLAWVERKNLEVRDQIEAMLTDMLQHREHIF